MSLHPHNAISRRSALSLLAVGSIAGVAEGGELPARRSSSARDTFLPIVRQPESIGLYEDDGHRVEMRRTGFVWRAAQAELTSLEDATELRLSILASTPLQHIHLRWKIVSPQTLRVLGDAWERSYGDLAWQTPFAERVMPWYFLTHDGEATHGYGVKVGAAALAFWQLDGEGVSLWLDVRNGGTGVRFGSRTLELVTIVVRQGHAGEEAFAAARAFCRDMSPNPRRPIQPIYGGNDWYYAYGDSSRDTVLRDADLIADLAPSAGAPPFTVIDDGWQRRDRFPSMPELAAELRRRGVRPGLWIRPLQAKGEQRAGLLLPASRFGADEARAVESPAYDPTIPEAREVVLQTIRQAVGWGYEMVKHDFSTFDLLGRWGFEMGASPTNPGWHFADRSQTNAEIVHALYRDLRSAAGESTVLAGCNVIGHLSAGIFDTQRTGDDVSGKLWERTRRMGVNTLGLRLPQHGAFFTMDADCVPVTPAIPWELTKSWLDATAASGTALFVSVDPASLNTERKGVLRDAFATAAAGKAAARPVDWIDSRAPELWRDITGRERRFRWMDETGAWPFEI